jgi:hypothetical protein
VSGRLVEHRTRKRHLKNDLDKPQYTEPLPEESTDKYDSMIGNISKASNVSSTSQIPPEYDEKIAVPLVHI